ncbi:extracellular calcium-sensing receptor-like [Protopterus annectens]|uniref:extracellular calcium-sensing receptor-like n=1 Tax=Protopterus annectens TaxID=7888 RepID=UPI001CFB5E47|nr:extracellular calcium-sensing receptor-like [Protopterus annectens]
MVEGITKNGDFIVGGIFPIRYHTANPEFVFRTYPSTIHCESFRYLAFGWEQAMVFAIEEINRSYDLLPNFTLGYQIYDSCYALIKSLEGTFWLLNGQEKSVPNYSCRLRSQHSVIIGDSSSVRVIPMARILGLTRYPQISYAASVSTLSDKVQFPSFLRMMPSDALQSAGLAQMMLYFGWSWVGILASDNEYGEMGSQVLRETLVKHGACLAFLEILPAIYSKSKITYLVNVIKRTLANAIVIFASDSIMNPITEELSKSNITAKAWVASEGWATSLILSKKDFAPMLQGTVGFAVSSGMIPGFKEYLTNIHPSKRINDIYSKLFWEAAFRCRFPLPEEDTVMTTNASDADNKLCSGKENSEALVVSLFDVDNLRESYNVYKSIYAVAQTLRDLASCNNTSGPFVNGSCAPYLSYEPWQLFHFMKNVHFHMKTSLNEEVFFDEHGDTPASYDVMNWQMDTEGSIKFIKVGVFYNHKLLINESIILWNGGRTKTPVSVCSKRCTVGYRKATKQGQPACCFDCIPCSEGEVSNGTGMTDCLKCLEDQWPNSGREKCIRKTVEFLAYEDPLGSALTSATAVLLLFNCFTCITFVKFRHTPVVRANNRKLSYILLFALMLCLLCALIFIGQPVNVTCMLRQATFGVIFTLCISCVLAKTIMVVIVFKATNPHNNLKKWLGYKLPSGIIFFGTLIQFVICIIWLIFFPPSLDHNMKTITGKILIECNDGSLVAFWCMLGYIGFLASVSLVVAFLARKLPDDFNEAKFICFSMLVFVSVWLSFIPAYLSTKGKYMVALEIFAILSSSAGLEVCIFFPKCYIIIFRPDLNTRKANVAKQT